MKELHEIQPNDKYTINWLVSLTVGEIQIKIIIKIRHILKHNLKV